MYIYNPRHNVYLEKECQIYSVDTYLIARHEKEIKWRLSFYSEDINCQDEVILNKDLVYLINSKGAGLLNLYRTGN